MSLLDPNNPTTMGPEKWNTAEAQENDYKMAIMNLFKDFKKIWINALMMSMKTITNTIKNESSSRYGNRI